MGCNRPAVRAGACSPRYGRRHRMKMDGCVWSGGCDVGPGAACRFQTFHGRPKLYVGRHERRCGLGSSPACSRSSLSDARGLARLVTIVRCALTMPPRQVASDPRCCRLDACKDDENCWVLRSPGVTGGSSEARPWAMMCIHDLRPLVDSLLKRLCEYLPQLIFNHVLTTARLA